jgi:hypothetical protein
MRDEEAMIMDEVDMSIIILVMYTLQTISGIIEEIGLSLWLLEVF